MCVGNYSELLSEHVLSITEMCACNRRKRSHKCIDDKHVCVLWIDGEVAPELWKRSARSCVHGLNCSRT